MPLPEPVALPETLSQHSRFLQRLERRYAAELALLPAGVPTRETMAATCDALLARGHALAAALRILRQLVMHRLVVLDCDQGAPLHDITACVTRLAELALDRACRHACAELDALHGAPRAPDGSAAALWIVGMGKLGARELNVSSDIDLIYVYQCEGETPGRADGRGRLSHHEYSPAPRAPCRRWSARPPSTASSFAWTWRCGPTATPARRRARWRRWRNTCWRMGASGSASPG